MKQIIIIYLCLLVSVNVTSQTDSLKNWMINVENKSAYYKAGNVGIGIDTPIKLLHIHTLNKDDGLMITTEGIQEVINLNLAKNSKGVEYGYLSLGGKTKLRGNGIGSDFGGPLNIHTETVNSGIRIYTEGITEYIALNLAKNSKGIEYGFLSLGGNTKLRGRGLSSFGGPVTVDGKLTVTGSDFAERFNINSEMDIVNLEGMLLVIDEEHEGQLTLCSEAYDKKVAGIVSGAGGVETGVLMGAPNTLADGDIPVAVSGRVYCYADATYGKIEIGDLLTTSPTEGHAMKAKRFKKSQGAVIGKAMTALKDGKGLVLVFINPQ